MFRDVLEQLAKGVMPDKKIVASKLDAALTKKIGVLQIPYLCQPTDPKINPPAQQLLVAAALLGESEKIQLALDILQTELGQRKPVTADTVSDAMNEAQEAVSRLLAAFPEEQGRWLRILAGLKRGNTEGEQN